MYCCSVTVVLCSQPKPRCQFWVGHISGGERNQVRKEQLRNVRISPVSRSPSSHRYRCVCEIDQRASVCVCVFVCCVIESESACAAQSSLTTGEVEEWEDADWTAGAFKWKEHARCEVCECVCAHAMHYTCTQRPAEYTSNAGTACMSGVGEEHRWTSAAQLEAKNVEFT